MIFIVERSHGPAWPTGVRVSSGLLADRPINPPQVAAGVDPKPADGYEFYLEVRRSGVVHKGSPSHRQRWSQEQPWNGPDLPPGSNPPRCSNEFKNLSTLHKTMDLAATIPAGKRPRPALSLFSLTKCIIFSESFACPRPLTTSIDTLQITRPGPCPFSAAAPGTALLIGIKPSSLPRLTSSVVVRFSKNLMSHSESG